MGIIKNSKRKNYLTWEDTFMLLADVVAQRSKDPNSQVGACIVNLDNVVVGLGYNGFPRGCLDDKLPWGRDGSFLQTKYPYVVHAEANAILNSSVPVKGCKLYVNLFPCNECAKLIIQSGIKEVIYRSDKYKDLDSTKASKKMLKLAGVNLKKLKPNKRIKILNVKN